MERQEAIKIALATSRSQGARHPRRLIEDLVDRLMAGQKPQSYGERFIHISLQVKGFLPTEEV